MVEMEVVFVARVAIGKEMVPYKKWTYFSLHFLSSRLVHLLLLHLFLEMGEDEKNHLFAVSLFVNGNGKCAFSHLKRFSIFVCVYKFYF